MDAFVRAFEDARQRLIRDEGRNVSVREVIRRAGFDDSQRAGVAYHLNPRKEWPRGHNVPAEVVRRLAAVLPMSEEELMRAAQVAAGYNVVERPWADVSVVVARFFGDKDVSDQEKQEVSARLLQIIADEATRRVSAD